MADDEIWREPVRGGYADVSFLGLDGMERMRASLRGIGFAPPIHHLTGLRPTEGGPGNAAFAMPASPWWQTSAGVFTPGVMAFLADAPPLPHPPPLAPGGAGPGASAGGVGPDDRARDPPRAHVGEAPPAPVRVLHRRQVGGGRGWAGGVRHADDGMDEQPRHADLRGHDRASRRHLP